MDIAALLQFIADHEDLDATRARFSDTPEVQLRGALRHLAAGLAAHAPAAAVRSAAKAVASPARATAAPARAAALAAATGSEPPPPVSARPAPRDRAPAAGPGRALVIYSDGASRGNPGLAGAGWVICDTDKRRVAEGGVFLGRRTNNEAEYAAAAMGLKAAAEMHATDVVLRADSELMVRQIQGRYRVKNARLLPLYTEVMKLAKSFKAFRAEHVPRAQNAAADEQANLAIDNR